MKYTNIENANNRIAELEKENAILKQKNKNLKVIANLWKNSYFNTAKKYGELK